MPKTPGTLSASNTGLFHKAPTAFTGYTPLKSLQAFQGPEVCSQHHLGAFSACSLQTPTDSIFHEEYAFPCTLRISPLKHTSCAAARVSPTAVGWGRGS